MALTLDFLFTPTYSTKTIAINDISIYPNDPPIVTSPFMEISVPGFDTVKTFFVPTELNIINTIVLGISIAEEPLPDGIYVFRYSVVSEGVTIYVEKTILRTEKLQEKFDSAFMKLDMMDGNSKLKKQQKISLDTINYFIQGAIAAANNCATSEATKLYLKADKLLYNFTERGQCCGVIFPNNFY